MRMHRSTVLLILSLAACNATRDTAQMAEEGALNAAPPPALRQVAEQPAAPPAHEHAAEAQSTSPPPLYSDLGSYHHPVSCSPQAQQYFDQGLRLIYGFNHAEAIRAFKEAARLDPNCAMAQWGIALAHGPNINSPVDAERAKEAYDTLQRAKALAPKASPAEQAYIKALSVRYSSDPNADRQQLDVAYADAMRQLARQYPDDLDAATLFAESMMDLRPWDQWGADGQPRPGTVEIVATLEGVLQKNPNHPGANHYYIHAIEASPQPEKALASADRLPSLVPGAGHLVHMPAHVYIRTGRYADAAEANRQAIIVDERYIATEKPAGFYPMMYYPHNIHFLYAATAMEGRSAESISAARRVTANVPPEMAREMPMLEYFTPTAYFALVRFGHWQEILIEPAPPADLQYTVAMWHYARGLAYVGTGQFASAESELAALKSIDAQIPADRIVGDNQPAHQLLRLANLVLAGEIAARQGQCEAAFPKLEEAVSIQDSLPYSEPPPWYFPVRDALGAVFLQCDRADSAAVVYREALARNPNSGWSLYGLAQAQRAMKQEGVAETEAQFAAAWRNADVKLTSSRF